MRIISLLFLCCASLSALAAKTTSPNGKLELKEKGEGWTVIYNGKPLMELPAIGLDGMNVSGPLRSNGRVKADYQMLSGKRLHCTNKANEYVAPLGDKTRVVVRLYNDGMAFRYEQTGGNKGPLPKEKTAYHINEGTRRWMQQWADSYEGFFPLSTT